MSTSDSVKVTFEGMRYRKRPGESVLEAMLRGGANVPFSCRKGSCHTCLMQVREGQPDPKAQRDLPEDMKRAGLFMPCIARDCGSMTVQRPDPGCWTSTGLVHEKRELAPGVYHLALEVSLGTSWKSGQFVNLCAPDGSWRSYSIASVRDDDYFLELLVEHWPDGKVSSWVAESLQPGHEVKFQGPLGACFYDPGTRDRPLLLIGTGTGISPLFGIAREALRAEHPAPVHLYHGAREPAGLYFAEQLRALATRHPNFHYHPCISGPQRVVGASAGRATDLAFSERTDLAEHVVFLCGNPEAVQAARVRAVGCGAPRSRIHADPFEDSAPRPPTDKQVLDDLAADPELWHALQGGALLTEILEDFYSRVYADPRLEPFFHRVTKERAMQKQYEFLRDLFTGKRDFFGARPFNAHHWMVISDELFDYREELFVASLRRHGLEEHLVRRWSALHERFRPDIVKSTPRGLVVNGVEQLLEGYSVETLAVGALCDGCESEMLPGSTGRMHQRTGELFCASCAARVVGASQLPSAVPTDAG